MVNEKDAKMEGAEEPGLEPDLVVPAANVPGHRPVLLKCNPEPLAANEAPRIRLLLATLRMKTVK